MGLFSRLLKLHQLYPGVVPEEDFLTEVAAHIIRQDPELFLAWIEPMNLLEIRPYTEIHVATQTAFEPLTHHELGSRFDFLIELVEGDAVDWLVIESKVGSGESNDQLQRYAEILHEQTEVGQKVLLYLTRDYDPKDPERILTNVQGGTVRFAQARWYQLYNFLRDRPKSVLVDELIQFMEERGMDQSNQFSTIDILAAVNFPKTLRMMDETLFGEVAEKFERTMGEVEKKHKYRFDQLRDHQRYFLYCWLKGDFWCGLGYVMDSAGNAGYPRLRLLLEALPKSKSRSLIIRSLREILEKRPGWKSYNLTEAPHYTGIYHDTSLRDLLTTEDHIQAVIDHFNKLLDELGDIKATYPDLPW